MSRGAQLQRKKILFLIPSLGGGGAQRVFSILLRHLDRSVFEPHLAVLEDSGPFIGDIPEDVVVHNLKSSRVRYALPGIVRLTWKLRPHTILSTMGHLNTMLLASKPLLPGGTRLVVRETVIASVFLAEEAKHPRLWTWLYRRYYPVADTVVCLSDSGISDMVNRFNVPREKLVRIYNPVDVEKVRQTAEQGANPFSGPGPHLVGVGRLTRQKGFDILIDSMPTVLIQHPDATLTILGTGELLEALQSRARKSGVQERVSFMQFQKNPWVYLKHADLFVLSSRYEGTPNSLLEALALNTRVVAADCPGGLREIQEVDDRVVLVPPEDPGLLAQAIVSVCRTPRSEEGEQLFRPRLRAFDAGNIVLEYSKLL
jgi:glycosyltransferase involved in cell wall biosynthesis